MSQRAHPRSRGENFPCRSCACVRGGSSPLTRGKPCRRVRSDADWRLIPAHAGKTTYEGSVTFPRAAHPRSRGENAFESAGGGEGIGSSPLTRGKRPHHGGHDKRRGLIPAHAGKTPRAHARAPSGRAHPRSRGENLAEICAVVVFHGSSPLTRGKRNGPVDAFVCGGLIPAHAGKTARASFIVC